MLKLNTALTALAVVLMAVLGYMGTQALGKLDATNAAQLQLGVKIDGLKSQVDDHETRIRKTETDVLILQQQQRDDRVVRPPKMTENKP